MNIFLRELRANRKSLIIWSVIVVLFSVVGFSKFSAFYGNPELLSVLDSMPPVMLEALSMNAFNLTTVTGFYGIMIVYFGLILTIAAAMWGSDIITKEERDKTVEFALTLPVTRSRLITAKATATLVNCVILLLVTWGITLVGARNFAPDAEFYRFVALSMLGFLFMQLIFLAVGIFLGAAMKRHKRAGSLAIAVILVTYFLSIVIELNDKLDFLKYLSPFKYFEAASLLHDSRVEVLYVILSLVIAVVFMAGAYIAYQKRDLYI